MLKRSDDGDACHLGNLTKCGSLKNYVGAKLLLMVDWSTIELRCSNLKRWEGPRVRVYIRTLGQSTAYMATYSDFRLVPKVTVTEWPTWLPYSRCSYLCR